MRFDSFSSRIFLTFGTLLAVLLASAAIVGETAVRSFHNASVEERMTSAADALRPATLEALRAARIQNDELERRVREVGAIARLRVTIITQDGNVVADSETSLPLENHADRAEIRAARANGRGADTRRSATTGANTFYVADRIDDASGAIAGFVRTATELAEMESSLSTLHRSLVLATAIALVGGLFASWLLARKLSAPLEAIEREAREIDERGATRAATIDAGPRETRRVATALRHMSAELSRRVDTARRAREELETILASMNEGVIAFDAEERVVLMNMSAARALGLREKLVAREPLWRLVRFPELERALRAILNGTERESATASAQLVNGRTVSIAISPLRLEGERERVSGAVALLSDVTEVRALEQVRVDFVANVSHELRTPLSAVLGALETLDDTAIDDDTRARFTDIGRRNATRLQAIVNDLLDLSAIEAEGGRLATEPLPVLNPLRTAAAALSGAAEAKHIRLQLPPGSEACPVVLGNAQRLEQVFTNLLENAIKYTPENGRVIVRQRSDESTVTVEVEDSGVGIPKHALSRVFERFYRVDRSRSREMGGTGLGLAIVKHAVRAHGGTVEVSSEVGLGSTFAVTLPLRIDAQETRGASTGNEQAT